MSETERLGKLDFEAIKREIQSIIRQEYQKKEILFSLETAHKKDGTVVTQIDKSISAFISTLLNGSVFPTSTQFYCEEYEQRGSLRFPALILDPIDGTKELALGLDECCFSMAYLHSENMDDPLNQAWLYNPFTGFELTTKSHFSPSYQKQKENYLIMVSRTEFTTGLYKNDVLGDHFTLAARGSIALKLGYLAAGACDLVVTKKPKNIWDIAAGTLLCCQRGILFYDENAEIKTWSEIYNAKMYFWGNPIILEKAQSLFQS